MGYRALAVVAFLLSSALPAHPQQSVTVQFSAGRVTLRAQNAPIRVILAEWARLGGATIVNADRVAGPPVTLELTSVQEGQALDVLLRGVAGYMLAPRRAGSVGTSAYDRIVILPTSTAPGNPPPPAVASAPRPGIIARQPRPVAAAQTAPVDAGQDDSNAGDDQAPEANQTRTAAPRPALPPFVMRPPVEAGAEPLDPDDNPNDAGEPRVGVAPTPTNPFGIPFGSSATPGVVTPVPQPARPQQRPATNGVQ